MIIGDRIDALLKEQGISQGELARRVGVSQPTIFKLIHENKTGSAHLHKVAKELGTTPAYLTGETDDPTSEDSGGLELTADERFVVDCLRQISSKDRAALIQLARSLASVVVTETHAPPSLIGVGSNPAYEKVLNGIEMLLGDTTQPTIKSVRDRKRPQRKLA